jgi:hypothetical protein
MVSIACAGGFAIVGLLFILGVIWFHEWRFPHNREDDET